MKTKTWLGLIGFTALGVGVIYYILKKKNRNDELFEDNRNMEMHDDVKECKDIVSSDKDIDLNCFDQKTSTIENLQQRHAEAGKLMRESLENIVSEEEDLLYSEHQDDFEKIDSDLDKLLDD